MIGVFDEVNLDNKSYWGDTVIVKKKQHTYPVSVANRALFQWYIRDQGSDSILDTADDVKTPSSIVAHLLVKEAKYKF